MPSTKQELIEKNLEFLLGLGEGTLRYAEGKKRWTKRQGKLRTRVDFYFDPETGVVQFVQDTSAVPTSIEDQYKRGVVELSQQGIEALLVYEEGSKNVVTLDDADIADPAKVILKDSVERYNQYGIQLASDDLLPLPDTVKRNLERMNGTDDGDMQRLLGHESFGGNAGKSPDGAPRAAANFYFDEETGEIKYFGNVQGVPDNIVETYRSGTFLVVWRMDSDEGTVEFEISDIMVGDKDVSRANISEQAELVLKKSAKAYNYER